MDLAALFTQRRSCRCEFLTGINIVIEHYFCGSLNDHGFDERIVYPKRVFMDMSNESWSRTATQDFWGEISPCEHVVQIYEDDHAFLNLLEGFISGRIKANDCVVVIATEEHLEALEARMKSNGYNVFELKLKDQYIPLNAKEALSEFMIDHWPDEVLFRHFIGSLISRAHAKKRRVRAFGEMVAMLWAQGYNGATIQLEHLWNKICEAEQFSLFCAYPRSGFTQTALESILNICGIHSKMIKLPSDSKNEILYKDLYTDQD